MGTQEASMYGIAAIGDKIQSNRPGLLQTYHKPALSVAVLGDMQS
jgi:hypothetical protein